MLRIGVLGAAGDRAPSTHQACTGRDEVEVAAVASRREAAAAAYAETDAIPIAHSTYEALLADQSIDLVYSALPPSERAELSIAALEAGKDVLCEKPIGSCSSWATAPWASCSRSMRRSA